ncbi:hypothetical protein SUGI_0624260 [Cryptomeria japonica]|uniref:cytochrome P450 72A397 isoform X1 n=1 Tax=Cryptomeria japonica TaxID=3369 RepID=UPI0024148546|nr:cytochrome P450 72A397 isoform X1 [Cryptomeria japonica]GLJ31154.1 hypothetical protein SUGI_0624260 [Cryptomeria japonica]
MSGWSDDVADAWSWNARFWSAMQESRALTMMREYVVHEVNAILWALLIIVTGLLLRRVWRLLRFWVRGSRLPGPPLNALARNKGCDALDQFTAFLGQAHKDYGSVVRVWLGPTQLLVSVKDPELIQHLLVQAKDRLPLTGKAFQLAFGKSSLFVSSFAQVQSRRISLERQLNGKFLERVHSISLKVVDRIKQWADVGPSGLELDCKTASQHMAFSILGATLFGDGFLIWPAAREFEDLLMMIAKECCFWATYNVLPLWNKNFQRYKATCLRLQDLTKHMIQEGKNQHRNVIESYNKIESANIDAGIAAGYGGTSGEFVEDLIAGIISSKDSSGNLNLSEEIRGDIMGMMFHGCLTTTGIISGVLTKLAQHPEVQAKVYQEIVSICGKSATPSFTDVQKMHFLLATIYESARLLPAGPLLQRCSLKHDMKLTKEITVPAGAILAVPIQLVQMDACKWGDDAEIFNPDRFLKQKTVNSDSCKIKGDSHKAVGLTEQGDTDLVENSDGQSAGSDFKDPDINYSFLPFGSGSRVCVGKRFASVEMTALLASLLQRYEIKLGPDSDMDLKPKIENFTLQLFPSPKLSLVPRGF